MHSEVIVRFTEEIRFDQLTDGLPPTSDPASVLAETFFSDSPDLLTSAVYARLESIFGYIVFRDDGRSIRLHVEGRANKGNLSELVRRSEHLAARFIHWGQSHGYRLDCALISLYADYDFIMSGQHRSQGDRLLKRFAETIFGDVVVGLFTCVLTGVLTGQWAAGVAVGIASVFCLVAWLAIEIGGGRDEYDYRRF